MTTRRGFIASLLVSAALPATTWADAGGPAYLSAAREPDGTYALVGLTAQGTNSFKLPLPARGHAGAAHPALPEAVVFARRPGTFALVIDCVSGRVLHNLEAPAGLHFSGHGTFSADGRTLFTSEVENAGGGGRIGVWESANYTRKGTFPSGGIGPHEIVLLPDGDTLAIANGGIIAALDDDRSKLNLDTMAPNLTYATTDGTVSEQVVLTENLHQNSIRHLAVASDGTVAFAMQWEGDPATLPPLLGLHKQGGSVVLSALSQHLAFGLKNYAASVAFDASGDRVAITCPKGGRMVHFDREARDPVFIERRDICGLSSAENGFFTTDGMGGVLTAQGNLLTPLSAHKIAWDNHLIRI